MKTFGNSARTLVHVVREAAASKPDKAWILSDQSEITFAEMETLSNRLANGLLEAGVAAGDTVMVMLPDCIETIAISIACAKISAIDVPTNISYRGDILSHIANDCGANIAIVGSALSGQLEEVQENIKQLTKLYILGESDAHYDGDRACGWEVENFRQLVSTNDDNISKLPSESQVLSIMYTSGTTGRSKGVMVTHAHAYEYALGVAESIELNENDVYYTAGLPLFHAAGRWAVLYAAAIFGVTAILPKQFSVSNFWPEVNKFGVTSAFLLGAMANLLNRQAPTSEDADVSLSKILLTPLLADSKSFAKRFRLRVSTGYGSTEANFPIYFQLGGDIADGRIVGKPRSDKFEVAIVDEYDNKVGPGDTGEIVVRPKQPWLTMAGYWGQPELTRKAWRNLWLHTGDAGRYDDEGNFYFLDRMGDSIRRRGENISSMEVEAVISQHPAVQQCAVFPVESEFTEQEVMASVVLKPGEYVEPSTLIYFAAERMAYFMVPRYLDILSQLPMTPTGKVKKAILRQNGITSGTWDREVAGVKITRDIA